MELWHEAENYFSRQMWLGRKLKSERKQAQTVWDWSAKALRFRVGGGWNKPQTRKEKTSTVQIVAIKWMNEWMYEWMNEWMNAKLCYQHQKGPHSIQPLYSPKGKTLDVGHSFLIPKTKPSVFSLPVTFVIFFLFIQTTDVCFGNRLSKCSPLIHYKLQKEKTTSIFEISTC